MKNKKTKYWKLTKVEYIGDYKLDLFFNDGVKRIVDFEPFLKRAVHPSIRKYLDIDRFKSFVFEFGHLQWNDYDLSFTNDDLHDGVIA